MRFNVRDNRRGPSRYSQLGECSCHAPLRGYVIKTAVRRGLAGLGAAETVPALLPVSDKRAVQNAIRLFQGGRGLSGLGDTAQAQSTTQYAVAGAKAGSVVPGVGAVIGLVVGAAVGYFLGKKPPPRPSGQEIAECKDALGQYMSAAAENQSTPIPLDEGQLKKLNWCLQAIYGAGDIKNRDPRFFDGNFLALMDIAKDVVRKIYDTPVGGTVSVADNVQKIRGQTFKSAGISFRNPPFTDLKSFARDVFTGIAVAHCKQTAGKGAGGCEQFYSRPEYQRLFYDMLGYAARTLLPNISEADLREASKVAAQTGSSASAVVAAVEQIIGKSVQRNQTAEMLSPGSSTRPPPETAPAPVPITVTPGGAASAPLPTQSTAAPTPATGPQPLTPSGLTPSMAADTRKQLDDLLAAGASQQQAFSQLMSSLQAQGVAPTPALQTAVANEVKAAGSKYTPYLVVGTVVAIGAALALRKRA